MDDFGINIARSEYTRAIAERNAARAAFVECNDALTGAETLASVLRAEADRLRVVLLEWVERYQYNAPADMVGRARDAMVGTYLDLQVTPGAAMSQRVAHRNHNPIAPPKTAPI